MVCFYDVVAIATQAEFIPQLKQRAFFRMSCQYGTGLSAVGSPVFDNRFTEKAGSEEPADSYVRLIRIPVHRRCRQ